MKVFNQIVLGNEFKDLANILKSSNITLKNFKEKTKKICETPYSIILNEIYKNITNK